MNSANQIYLNGSLKKKSLFKFLVSRVPDFLVSTVLIASKKESWLDSYSLLLNCGEIFYINNEESRRSESIKEKKDKFRYCKIHKKCQHHTADCNVLNKINSAGFKVLNKQKNVKRIFSRNNKNPFVKEMTVDGSKHHALVDTGADVSLINKSNISKSRIIDKTSISAANGSNIKTLGKVHNLPAVVNNKKIIFDPYVVKDRPKYSIIGTDTLKRYPEIVYTCLEDMNTNAAHPVHVHDYNQAQIALINNEKIILTEELTSSLSAEISKRYSSIFAGELSENTLCLIKKHEINTGNHPPICEQNARIPIALESKLMIKFINC